MNKSIAPHANLFYDEICSPPKKSTRRGEWHDSGYACSGVTMQKLTESEWKLFSQLRKNALQRFCERTLAELQYVMTDPEKTPHERYLELFKKLHERDEELAYAFNGSSRSNALLQLMVIHKKDLLTPEELAQFRDETRQKLASI